MARSAVEKALALDASLARAHATLGWILWHHDWDWEEAETELREAVRLAPNDAQVLTGYGEYLTAAGRFDEAQSFLVKAVDLAPLDPGKVINLWIWIRQGERDHERSVDYLLRWLDKNPLSVWGHQLLGDSYRMLGREEEAYQAWTSYYEITQRSDDWLRGWERGFQESGMKGALRYLVETETKLMKTEHVNPYLLAEWHVSLGEPEEALAWLERAYEGRNLALAQFLGVDPRWDPFRSDPRFHELLRKINWPGLEG